MNSIAAVLLHKLIAIQVYGANTGVGKTVVSAAIARTLHRRQFETGVKWQVNYLKPVSTGPMQDADYKYFERYTPFSGTCLHQYGQPLSPHVAARLESRIPRDFDIVREVRAELAKHARSIKENENQHFSYSIVETAGGVLSPGPSGTPQADLYRPLRLPVLLVGDHRLGGIAATISAYESLTIRGYDVEAIVMFDSGQFGNVEYLTKYFAHQKIPTFKLPETPSLVEGVDDYAQMHTYYDKVSRDEEMSRLTQKLEQSHSRRWKSVRRMAATGRDVVWHPFTQHKDRKSEDVMAIDSAYGDFFQANLHGDLVRSVTEKPGSAGGIPMLQAKFDGSASWWTQGLGHGNPELALAAAYAAGRYGHVMFAGAVHQPALELAQRLLSGMGNPRLKRVFFSDNGSTGTEVAVKMALKAASLRNGWDGSTETIEILGLKGSYHGDTIGAMDMSEQSVFNTKVEWYRGRGHWFDFPQVKMKKGKWIVEPPVGMEDEFGPPQIFENLADIFDFGARDATKYESYIEDTLNWLVRHEGRKFGALVMEPVLLGAGGMLFADPLFQRTLVRVARYSRVLQPSNVPITPDALAVRKVSTQRGDWTGLPVVFDEVFTGLYRLGRFSAASFLDVHPDISVHAKLLTGGLLPLSTTLASQRIFEAFLSDEKSDALLHGHSYTAHAIGCHVANVSLEKMEDMDRNPSLARKKFWSDWHIDPDAQQEEQRSFDKDRIWSMWSKYTVTKLSHHDKVDSVISLGSVLAISLKDESGSGYTSNAAAGLRDALLGHSNEHGWGVHSRVLGNVLYLMASITSNITILRRIEALLLSKLDRMKS